MDRRLLTFLAVARAGNITAAARELNITQPTLTKRLQLLEAEFGCRLVERLPRGVALTREGRALMPHAERVRDALFQGAEAVRAVRSGHLDDLRVGAGPLFHLRFLGGVFARLRAEHPRTTLRLTADFNSRLIPRLLDGRLDVTFGTRTPEADAAGLDFHPVLSVERGAIVRRGHPIGRLPVVTPADLADLPWVVFSDTDETEAMIGAYFAAQGHGPPEIALQTTSLSLAFEMVAGSDAAMALPVQLAPILGAHELAAHRTEPSIGVLPAGAYVRRSSLDYPVVARAIALVAEAAAGG